MAAINKAKDVLKEQLRRFQTVCPNPSWQQKAETANN